MTKLQKIGLGLLALFIGAMAFMAYTTTVRNDEWHGAPVNLMHRTNEPVDASAITAVVEAIRGESAQSAQKEGDIAILSFAPSGKVQVTKVAAQRKEIPCVPPFNCGTEQNKYRLGTVWGHSRE